MRARDRIGWAAPGDRDANDTSPQHPGPVAVPPFPRPVRLPQSLQSGFAANRRAGLPAETTPELLALAPRPLFPQMTNPAPAGLRSIHAETSARRVVRCAPPGPG